MGMPVTGPWELEVPECVAAGNSNNTDWRSIVHPPGTVELQRKRLGRARILANLGRFLAHYGRNGYTEERLFVFRILEISSLIPRVGSMSLPFEV